MMTDEDRAVARELKERLLAAGGAHIRKIIVYGSRARGDAGPDSDMDVAVVVDERSPELVRALRDAAYEVMWNRAFVPLVMTHVFEEQHFDARFRAGYSFYENVVAEGVVL